jgi:hypothetical protein
VSMRIVVLMGFVGGVFVLTFLFCHSIHVTEKKARAKKEARLRERVKNNPQLPLPRLTFPVEDFRAREQLAISSAKTIRSIEIALSSLSAPPGHRTGQLSSVSYSRESSSRSDSSSSQSSASSRRGSSSPPHQLRGGRNSVDGTSADHPGRAHKEGEDEDQDSVDMDSLFSGSSLSTFASLHSDSDAE